MSMPAQHEMEGTHLPGFLHSRLHHLFRTTTPFWNNNTILFLISVSIIYLYAFVSFQILCRLLTTLSPGSRTRVPRSGDTIPSPFPILCRVHTYTQLSISGSCVGIDSHDAEGLRRHRLLHQHREKFSCPKDNCNKSYITQRNLNGHLASDHSTADATWWVTDPNEVNVPTKQLISREYLAERAKLSDPKKASKIQHHGSPAHSHSDTVYFAVSDSDGNAVPFINSNYGGLSMAAIPHGCGFTLQNRGSNFSLDKGNPNALAPRKRPYHTIIPALVTNKDDGSLHSVYGAMGGFMQPQGHVQVLLNQLTFNHDPQTALDAPRFCIGAGMSEAGEITGQIIYLEDGIEEKVVDELKSMGIT